jgi:citrate lyase subunit beta / citryl-CoA lyase
MRSFLFVPADSPRKIDKSFTSAADALILDLEDAVAPQRKDEARRLAREALGRERAGRRVFVRVNAFDTGLTLADLGAVMPGAPDGVVLPKCAGRDDIVRLDHVLDGMEAALALPPGRTSIIAVATETPAAVLGLAGYAGSSARLCGLMWGAEDLAGALGASSNRTDGRYRAPFELARNLCLLGAAAAEVMAIDAVYTDFADAEGLRAEASAARVDGFRAKAAIHPDQCAIVNAAFEPSEAERRWARAVLDALAATPAGVASLDGRMIDRPHEVQARRILGLAAPGGPVGSG